MSDGLDALQARLDKAAPGSITITPSDVAWLQETARKQDDTLSAVRALHRSKALPCTLPKDQTCTGCGHPWPCPTTQALDGA
ncbi:hypothetical protein [Arthrobacter sp. SAFR-014]|uniref:hypothetical protein n=1 Tax=unclassified Arthrobacter TaxID=235627 RepID=UPI003F7C688E